MGWTHLNDFLPSVTREATLCLPVEKGSSPEGKNLLPREANSFLLEYTPFQKRDNINHEEMPPSKCVNTP